MIYMKFEKKMLRGSDFFLDFSGPDLAQILGFGALRGQFWTIEIQKTPKLFRPGGSRSDFCFLNDTVRTCTIPCRVVYFV